MTAKRLTQDDWTGAALRAMAKRGVAGVAVEPLAKELGATKGSFYWHFANREELVTAALERWERESTDAVMETLDPLPTAEQRLRQLLEALFVSSLGVTGSKQKGVGAPGSAAMDTSIALTADATQHPVVAEVVARVSARRIAYVADQLVASGVGAKEARHRALFAYTAYLGHSMLARSAPAAMPARGKAAAGFVDEMLRLLAHGAEPEA